MVNFDIHSESTGVGHCEMCDIHLQKSYVLIMCDIHYENTGMGECVMFDLH